MAETITYPENSYGIMPSNSFNKYIRFNNQRRAATGLGATETDKKAFWEGTMDSVVKNSAQRAAQSLENKRYALSELSANRNYELSKEQLENQKSAGNKQAIGSLAQIPLTAMMYDALGLRKDNIDPKTGIPRKTLIDKGVDWFTNQYDSLFTPETSDLLGARLADSGESMYGWDNAIPSADVYDFGNFDAWLPDAGTSVATDFASSAGDLFDWGSFGESVAGPEAFQDVVSYADWII